MTYYTTLFEPSSFVNEEAAKELQEFLNNTFSEHDQIVSIMFTASGNFIIVNWVE